ncbi:MAG: UDP-N-acetylmuramoyl-L-alanine--D-glutamate ligase [Zoogloeaceae bacterium]|jgi:UDP-N-acetylmuramoylalanine--D-glutamate ligase|nr:UDP-N-acetylmuramoyl-L-alanine--D-glutamate ligase [Zoogloeaceae bacterium]
MIDFNRRFLVAGLGESGLAMARWLTREGAQVVAADSRANPPGRDALRRSCPELPVETGPFRAPSFAQAEIIALSPGIDPKTLPPTEARFVSEIDLFMDAIKRYAPASRTLAITGSNGKTTTTALTAHLLNSAGIFAVACGNISPSLLDAFMAAQDNQTFPAVWVMELSSFQLETAQSLDFSAAALLNLSEDHLDRYDGDIERYAAAKARIFQGGAKRLLNREDAFCHRLLTPEADIFGLDAPARTQDAGFDGTHLIVDGKPLLAATDLPLTGLHNVANALSSLLLCRAIGVAPARLVPGLKTFCGLPHRMEFVADIDGVRAIDDSKGTNVGATLAAIAGAGAPVAVLLGGDGKGQDFSPLAGALAAHGRAAAVIGKDAAKIAALIAPCGIPVCRFAAMDSAVAWLFGECQKGDVLLLSPACASWDMYRDYAHRAEVFRAAIHKLQEEAKA